MVGNCLCATNGSFAVLSDELGFAAASEQGFRWSCRWDATAGPPSVEHETVDSSGGSAVRNLVLDPMHIVACACVFIFGSLRRRCLLLALLFLPAVGSVLSPAAGPFFPAVVALFTCCGSALLSSFHAAVSPLFSLAVTINPSRRSEPRSCIASFWTSAFVFWLLVSGSSQSCF